MDVNIYINMKKKLQYLPTNTILGIEDSPYVDGIYRNDAGYEIKVGKFPCYHFYKW